MNLFRIIVFTHGLAPVCDACWLGTSGLHYSVFVVNTFRAFPWPGLQCEMPESPSPFSVSFSLEIHFLLLPIEKDIIFWGFAMSVNHFTFSMRLNQARSRNRLVSLQCVCVLCINRTCGSTYHGLFIWGISLPALLTLLWLVGFEQQRSQVFTTTHVSLT